MWWKVTGDVKCPRGDCIYHSYSSDVFPCSTCNANMKNTDNMNKSFNFKSKDVDSWLEKMKAEKEGGINAKGENKPTSAP